LRDPVAGPPTILALVDLTADDAPVVAAARALARALAGPSRATIALLHVAPPVSRRRRASWARMEAIEAAARATLHRWAARLSRRGFYVQTAVRFGDPVEQVAKTAIAVGATAVVAASRPAGWRWWQGRDRRLRQTLDIPVSLVPARGDAAAGYPGTHRPDSASPSPSRSAA
jgi:nucleotide-binding universal stress UspA family protein